VVYIKAIMGGSMRAAIDTKTVVGVAVELEIVPPQAVAIKAREHARLTSPAR